MRKKVDLLAAFLGLKFLPLPFVLGYNNINPKLIFYDDYVEYRALILTNEVYYSDIEEIDIFIHLRTKTTNLCIKKLDSVFTFVGNLNDRQKLIEVVKFLESKECPLSLDAKDLITNENNSF